MDPSTDAGTVSPGRARGGARNTRNRGIFRTPDTSSPAATNTGTSGTADIADMLRRMEYLEQKVADYEQRILEYEMERTQPDTRRDTVYTEGGTAVRPSRPKLEKPDVYNGEYKIEYSVLNWVTSVSKYLDMCDVAPNMYPQYAYTYMGRTVKAWYDHKYKGKNASDWETLVADLKSRWLPADHKIRVRIRFNGARQKGTLIEYVERFQALVVAVNEAGILLTEEDMVLQFIMGLTHDDDRQKLLQAKPSTLDAAYAIVDSIRQSKVLKTYKAQRDDGAKSYAMEDDMVCYNCGKKGHMARACKEPKKDFKRPDSSRKQLRVSKGEKKSKNGKKSRSAKMNHIEEESSSEVDEQEQTSDDTDSGNESSESEGETPEE